MDLSPKSGAWTVALPDGAGKDDKFVVRLGDYDLDGYPDLLLLLEKDSNRVSLCWVIICLLTERMTLISCS